MTSFSGMDIAAVEAMRSQLLSQTQALESVVTGIHSVAAALQSPSVWNGPDAEVFRASLNDQLVALRSMPPAFEALIQNLSVNINAQQAASGA